MPRPREFDDHDVVATARDHFWTHGYAGTSVGNLVEATGLGKGSLYGAFGDKHGLFLRALEDYIGTMIESIQYQLRDPARSAYDRLVRHLRTQARSVAADRDRRGCMLAKSAAELGATDEATERAAERAYAIWEAEIAACIRQAQRDGAIDSGADPHALATALLSFLRGLEALNKGGARPADLIAATEQIIVLIPRG
ncbi:MAG TPA: TetR/AcrR family transcriptional regulator [Mycobacterium sp.]|nr:TetR/AcrR family transcriptional regulator [Mycobacterium sp.]